MRLPRPIIAAALSLSIAGCSGPAPTGAGPSSPAGATTETSAPGGATTATTPGAPPSRTTPPATAGRCSIFPADNIWHADVSRLPVQRGSASLVASIGTGSGVHADFGAGQWDGAPIGIPVTAVPSGQAGARVTFQYASESDPGPYPIPRGVKVEGGGDRHVILYDAARCRSFELFAARQNGDGTWRAGSGAVFDLRSNRLRPRGWTSADASGLSILAGLVRYEEVAAGRIDHAIRMTAPRTRDAYVWPATHAASDLTDSALPPMGQRLRLKAGVDTSKLPRQARVVAEAMKRYGVILADNGSPWYLSGVPDDRWSNDALHALGALKGSDFEAVDVSGLMISRDSAACRRAG